MPTINSDLTSGVNLANAVELQENGGAYIGVQKNGPFEVDGEIARAWLLEPANVNGRPNSDVLRPWCNGSDITGRPSGRWIVDFGTDLPLEEAQLYQEPFEHVLANVKPLRAGLRRANHRDKWWIHGEARPGLRRAIAGLSRMLATPRVAKHRIFVWLSTTVVPDSRLVVIAKSDDVTFGVLHSRYHEVWSIRRGGMHGVGNDPQYTPSLGFLTFPFPEGLAPYVSPEVYAADPRAIAIAEAAARLNELRENWLNPPDLVTRVPEVVPGYPDRILPVDDAAAEKLKKRTLTNLYNERPAWLQHAHMALDEAVAAAYGWPADLPDDEVLARLFELNQQRAAKQ